MSITEYCELLRMAQREHFVYAYTADNALLFVFMYVVLPMMHAVFLHEYLCF